MPLTNLERQQRYRAGTLGKRTEAIRRRAEKLALAWLKSTNPARWRMCVEQATQEHDDREQG